MADGGAQEFFKELTLNGRLRTADDPVELISEGGIVDFQELKNMRYSDSHPQGIGGCTKINTTALANPKIKNAFHFKKDFPTAESHVLVRALNSSNAAQKVYRQSVAIPGTGDFTSAAAFTDSTGYGTGQFSTAPQDRVVYCNGKDVAIWGGSEIPPLVYLDQAPDGTYKYDYTSQVQNDLTDANNIATIHSVSGALDANTMLLLHLNNNLTDSSPTTAHTITNVSNKVLFSTSYKKFGTHSASFNGTDAYLTIPDNADFDLSDGTWTIDFWICGGPIGNGEVIYYHGTDATNYFQISAVVTGSGPTATLALTLSIVATTAVVKMTSTATSMPVNRWMHFAFVENGNNFYIFRDGSLSGSAVDTDRPANYTGVVCIGADATPGNFFTGYIDELRVSNSTRWPNEFDPPTSEYGTNALTSIYVASPLPLQGIKFYVGTANTASGTLSISYWDSTYSWTGITATDGTTVGGVPLAQTGSITFASTVTTEYPSIIDDVLAFWYKIEILDCDTTTTITQVTLDAPMQNIKELWDGLYSPIASFQKYTSSQYNDYTLNVREDSWTSTGTGTTADASTMVELDSLATSTEYIVVGFSRRMSGLRINLIGGHVNTVASTIAEISYCNGVGPTTSSSAWTSAGNIDDQTSTAGVSFSKSGVITWNSPAPEKEFKAVIGSPSLVSKTERVQVTGESGDNYWKTITSSISTNYAVKSSGADIRSPLYWYKISFSATLHTDVQMFYIGGIPASESIGGYKFSTNHADRLWLWGDERNPNRGICSAMYSPQVLSGDDCIEIYLGDSTAPVCGRSLFTRFGSTTTNMQIICKPSSTWAIIGETLDNFRPYLLSDSIGCVAPLTMDVGTAEVTPGTFRRLAVWVGQDGVYMSDGNPPACISNDIRDKFDPKHANFLGNSVLPTLTGFIDSNYNEYHMVIPSSTDWVYDFRRRKWSEAPKASLLNCGVSVNDVNGVAYSYGCTNTGYMERLEYGTTFDGTAIAYSLHTGDIAPTGGISDRTELRSIRLIGKSKTTTTETISVTHYGDTSTTASVPTITPISMSNVGKRLFNVIRSVGNAILLSCMHSIKLSISTNNEAVGFEPIFMILGFKNVGKDRR
jgi:hypothetical protein